MTSATNGGFYSGPARQAVAAVVEEVVKEVASTPEVVMASVPVPARSATVAANGGFYTGPGHQAVAAFVEEVTSTPVGMKASVSAPARLASSANGGFYVGPARQAAAAVVEEVVKEVTSTPEVAIASGPALARIATVAANGGFYAGPARQAVAAVAEEVMSMPMGMTASAPAPARPASSANGGFYVGPARQAVAEVVEEVVKEVTSTPEVVMASGPAPAQAQTFGSKSYGFYTGPARHVVAAIVSQVPAVAPVQAPASAAAPTQTAGFNGGFYAGPGGNPAASDSQEAKSTADHFKVQALVKEAVATSRPAPVVAPAPAQSTGKSWGFYTGPPHQTVAAAVNGGFYAGPAGQVVAAVTTQAPSTPLVAAVQTAHAILSSALPTTNRRNCAALCALRTEGTVLDLASSLDSLDSLDSLGKTLG